MLIVTVRRIKVAPSGGRVFSTCIDATRHVDCQRHTQLIDCDLRGQFDDAANIHASFSLVAERLDARRARLQLIHPQRYGKNSVRKGMQLAWYHRQDLTLIDTATVLHATALNQEFCEITVNGAVPDGSEIVCSLYDPTSRVTVRGNNFGANRGRGLLINMEHKVLVEDNRMHVSGLGIESVPDANYWWEGNPVRDLTIRHNVFDHCGFRPCGEAIMELGPELPDGADPRFGAIRIPTQKRAEVSRAALGRPMTVSWDIGQRLRILQGIFSITMREAS